MALTLVAQRASPLQLNFVVYPTQLLLLHCEGRAKEGDAEVRRGYSGPVAKAPKSSTLMLKIGQMPRAERIRASIDAATISRPKSFSTFAASKSLGGNGAVRRISQSV